MLSTTEFKTVEIKDYSQEKGINQELESTDALSSDFRFTDNIDFDQQFEGVTPSKFLTGSFGKISNTNGFEISADTRNLVSFLQTLGFLRKGSGWRLDSHGNITVIGLNGNKIELDGSAGILRLTAPDGDNAIEFRDSSGALAALINTFYSGAAVSGIDIIGGGGSELLISGKSTLGSIFLGFDDGVDSQGVLVDWSGSDLDGTAATTIRSRLILPATSITVGASFSLTAVQIETPYVRLSGGGSPRTSSAVTAIADGTEGQVLILEGTDDTNTVTILDGANVNLVGNNAVLKQRDTLTLIHDGSVWNELARQISGVNISGTYSPSVTSATNLDATPTATTAFYTRVGDVVTVSGRVTVNPTTTLNVTNFELSLPISSNLANLEDLTGQAVSAEVTETIEIYSEITNNTAEFNWIAVDVAESTYSYIFRYRVL